MALMKILILGMDGYIGWSLAMYLANKGHQVSGIDNGSRRQNVGSIDSTSALPIKSMHERISAFKKIFNKNISFYNGDLLDYNFLKNVICEILPDTIVHLAEQPSAPFSMIDREHAIYTQHNNIEGNLNVLYAIRNESPESHLVKLGTMGEYGTPNIDIPEGFFEIEYNGRKDILPFPRQPNSIYHLSKVHDSANCQFASRVWGISCTDIMQGVVYGSSTAEVVSTSLFTRFDFDESFGTAVNRFCSQAVIGSPLTPYGKGKQKRGFIDLLDSIQCLRIAIENPPDKGEYRVFNQIDEIYDIIQLAEYVMKIGINNYGLDVSISNIPNPRKEREEHYYKVENNHLRKLGYKPTRTIEDTIDTMINDLIPYKEILTQYKKVIQPKTLWDDRKQEKLTPYAK